MDNSNQRRPCNDAQLSTEQRNFDCSLDLNNAGSREQDSQRGVLCRQHRDELLLQRDQPIPGSTQRRGGHKTLSSGHPFSNQGNTLGAGGKPARPGREPSAQPSCPS
jgi:hypothetical protein